MKKAKSILLWCGELVERWRGCLPAKALASEGASLVGVLLKECSNFVQITPPVILK